MLLFIFISKIKHLILSIIVRHDISDTQRHRPVSQLVIGLEVNILVCPVLNSLFNTMHIMVMTILWVHYLIMFNNYGST